MLLVCRKGLLATRSSYWRSTIDLPNLVASRMQFTCQWRPASAFFVAISQLACFLPSAAWLVNWILEQYWGREYREPTTGSTHNKTLLPTLRSACWPGSVEHYIVQRSACWPGSVEHYVVQRSKIDLLLDVEKIEHRIILILIGRKLGMA
jgi:hypothetical protein